MPLALDQLQLSLALLGLVSAGVIKGITGIGYATCAMPLLALAVGVDKALALVVVPGLLSNAAVLASAKTLAPVFGRFRGLYLASMPGIVAGTILLGIVDPHVAGLGLALMTLAYVAIAITRPSLSMPARYERPLAAPAGFLTGVLTGLTGSQILPLVPYMLALRLEAEEQALAINLAVTIASCVLGVALLASGIMTPELLMLSCAFSAPAIVATWIGSFCRGFLEVEVVRQLTLSVLVATAAGLICRPLLDVALVAACGREIADQPLLEAPFICLAALDAALQQVSPHGGPPPS